MKKILIFTLVTILLFGSFQGSYAVSNKNVSQLYKIHGNSLSLNSFNQKFNIGNEFSNKVDTQIAYKYFIDFDEDCQIVTLTGELENKGDTYKFQAKGEVEEILKDSNLIEGSLHGNITIGGEKHKLLVGFSKKNNQICLSMNIYNGVNSIVMIFGKPVISENDMEKIEREKQISSKRKNVNIAPSLQNDKMPTLRKVTRYFDYVDSANANMESSKIDDERGVKVKLYQEEDDGELLLLRLRSYAEDIQNVLNDKDPFSREVELYEVKAGFELAKGKCDGWHPPEEEDGSRVDVFSIIYDALNALGLPTNTFADILDSAINGSKGYLKVYESNIVPYLKMRAGSRLDLDFDDEYVPFFVIGIDGNRERAEGTFYAEMEYRERYRIPGDGDVYIYYESEKAEENFDIKVID
ncbi:hypothetical protein [Maledivibacter halophilus]|uniref:Uncharacterized protein n=1 Tax=Maledivibacter halophilus TaxID=36842 RepID=A0A1T5MNS4_9FIRM|nr:hypothetical protein [Maledivibacter halophilus]SKC89880.1 hypothetical protein SAMN02194393_05089 [Maledivibacter halophilus]